MSLFCLRKPMKMLRLGFSCGFIMLTALISSEALEKCQPNEAGSASRAVVLGGSSSLYTCDVCVDGNCNVDYCIKEVHMLAVQNSYSGIIQVDVDLLNDDTEALRLVLVLSSMAPVTWQINLKTDDIVFDHAYVTGQQSTAELRNEYGELMNPVVFTMASSLYIDGTNIDYIYNMDGMSSSCVLSFTGIESTEKFTLYVGAEAGYDNGDFQTRGVTLPGQMGNDEEIDVDDPQPSADDVTDITDLILLVGAIIGGSLAFICLVGCAFIAFRQQAKNKQKRREDGEKFHNDSEVKSSEMRISAPPTYSQALYDGKVFPPPPSSPLPPAPGENIYSELGEKPASRDSGYLEPVESIRKPEKVSGEEYEELREDKSKNDYQKLQDKPRNSRTDKETTKARENSRKRGKEPGQYEELQLDASKNDYQKLQDEPRNVKPDAKITRQSDKAPKKDQAKEKIHSDDLERNSAKRSGKLPRNDEDEDGYLKLTK